MAITILKIITLSTNTELKNIRKRDAKFSYCDLNIS